MEDPETMANLVVAGLVMLHKTGYLDETRKPRNLLSLPRDVLNRIWEYTLDTSYNKHTTVICSHISPGRRQCPALLLVSRKVYWAAVKALYRNRRFHFCSEPCFNAFMDKLTKPMETMALADDVEVPW